MNVGIMGGTFDPIHIGHLIAAERAKEQADLDEVWFMPSSVPPHKAVGAVSEAQDRLMMVKLAIAGNPGFRINEFEIERGGTSYTIDTARLLRERYPGHRFSWIIGADMIAYLPKWSKIEELLELIDFIGLQRPGFETVEDGLPQHIRSKVRMVDAPLLEISSTDLRDRIRSGQSVKYMLTAPVESYIKEKGLYGS